MKELRQTLKNEVKLRNNILKLHAKGLTTKSDADIYLERIQDSTNHIEVINDLDKIIKLASCVLNPLESNDSLYDILMEGAEQ